jgi:PIN domain
MAEIRLRPGGSLAALEGSLREQASESDNTASKFSGGHPKDYLSAYLAWVSNAWRMLGNQLPRRQLEQLLHTRDYWALRQMDGSEAWPTGQIRAELNARRDALIEMADEARALDRRWNIISGVIVVPDTNLLVHTTELFDALDWQAALDRTASIHLVIPMVVVDQIDSLKRSRTPVRGRARQTAKKIENLLGSNPSTRVRLSDREVETTVEVLTDPLDHERLADSDSEIVDRAAYLRDMTKTPVYVATWDNLMTFRASVVDLQTIRPLPEYELPDDAPEGGRRPSS